MLLLKKITNITVCLLLFYPISSFAGWSDCKINDSAAPKLLDYLKNVDTITSTIISNAYSWEKAAKTDNLSDNAIDYLVTSLWWSIEWDDLFSSFDFNLSLPITNEVPAQVKRDHKKLTEKTEELIKLFKKLLEDWYWNVKVEDACWSVNNCQFEWKLAKSMLAEVIENNKNMVVYYRYKIIDKEYSFSKSLIFTPEWFELEMWKYYNKDTLTKCSKYEWWFLWEIEKKIDSIWKMFTKWHGMYDDWNEGFNLLKWINEDNKEKEAEILKKYLSSIWMDKKHSDIMLENLEKYNLWWLSSSDPISNSYNNSYNNIDKTKDVFETALIALFKNWEKEVTPEQIKELMPDIQSTLNIENKIKDMVQPEVYFAFAEDNSSKDLELDIIEMHIWLTDAIKILTKTIPDSEKVCDDQCSGWWKCSYQ